MTLPLLRLLSIAIGFAVLTSFPISQIPIPSELSDNPLSTQDQASATALAGSVSEWMGPLAPIAISPFFGITCLSAISLFGEGYVPVNSFVSSNPALNNPTIFWVFLGLTLVTSIPRFTKVSKPMGQAIDQIEAYAGIITILVIRFLPGLLESNPPEAEAVVYMGVFAVTVDALLAVAAIINILVINTVKFFFEVLVWLIPVPFVDAALEIANKTICAGLMAIYAITPLGATLINLILFLCCLVVFRWVNRQVTYLRSIVGDPIWGLFSKRFATPHRNELTVFPKSEFDGFPAKSKLILRSTDKGWVLIQPRWFMPARMEQLDNNQWKMTLREGLLINAIEVNAPLPGILLFSRRYQDHLDELAKRLNVDRSSEAFEDDLRTEMADA